MGVKPVAKRRRMTNNSAASEMEDAALQAAMAASLLEMDQTREREGEEREEEDERRRRRRRLMTSSSSASLLAATTATATTATPTTATTTTATNLTKPSVGVGLMPLHASSSHPKQPLQSHIEHTTTTTHSGQFTLSLKAGPAEEIHVPLNLITALNKALQLQQQQQQQQQQQLSPSDSSSQHSSTSHTPAPIQHPSAPSLNTATCITPTFNSSNLHPPSPPQLLQQDQDKPRIQLKNSTTAVSSTPSPVLPSSDPILPPPHDTNSSPPPTARSPFTGTSTMPAQSTALTHTTVSFSSARNPSTIKLNASAQQDSEGGNSILVDEVEDVSSDDPGEEEEGGEIVDLLKHEYSIQTAAPETPPPPARPHQRAEEPELSDIDTDYASTTPSTPARTATPTTAARAIPAAPADGLGNMPAHLRKALLKKRNGHWRKAAGTGSPRDAGEDSHAQEYAESAEPAIPEEVIQHHLTRELTVLAAIHESNLQACAVARAAAHAYAERVFQGARKSAEDSYLTGRARARALVNEDVCVRVARLRGERVRWEVKSLDTVYKVPSECAPPTASVVVDKMSIATLCDALPEDCVENDIAYIRMMTS